MPPVARAISPFGAAKKFPAPQGQIPSAAGRNSLPRQGQITDCPELRRAIAFRLRQAYAETGGVAQNGLILSEDGLSLSPGVQSLPPITPMTPAPPYAARPKAGLSFIISLRTRPLRKFPLPQAEIPCPQGQITFDYL